MVIVMSYRTDDLSMTNHFVVSSRHNSYAPIEHFYCLSLKEIEFNGVDITDFLRNFVFLMYLFICIDISKSYWKKNLMLLKIYWMIEKSLTKSYFLMASTLFSVFFELAVFDYFLIFR